MTLVDPLTFPTRTASLVRRRLADALARRALEVHYQPIVEAGSGRVTMIEALARLPDGKGGWLSPDVFIPLAERFGLISELFDQVSAQALAQFHAWREAGHALRLSLNVSRVQLRRGDFPHRMLEAVERRGLVPADIVLEITETLPADPVRGDASCLRVLSESGFALAIDDFGAGYADVDRIAECPWDILKIDRSLLIGQSASVNPPEIVETLLCMAHGIGLETVAEGVEDFATARWLSELGVGAMQGQLFGRPCPATWCGALLGRGMLVF